jgi:hypothetical protein
VRFQASLNFLPECGVQVGGMASFRIDSVEEARPHLLPTGDSPYDEHESCSMEPHSHQDLIPRNES